MILFQNLFAQIQSGDNLTLSCGTKPSSDTVKFKYSGLVISSIDRRAIPDIKVKICQFGDTAVLASDSNGHFETTLLADCRNNHLRILKLLLTTDILKGMNFS